MSNTFEVGDVVQLRSGGEPMTVEEVNGFNISCVWKEGKKTEREEFLAATLHKHASPRLPSVDLKQG